MIYVALLRGINVSGHRLIKMANLQVMFRSMGLGQVQTYIQSGNVLFESEEEAEPLRRRIEQQIHATFGFADVPVVLRTAAELEQIVSDCPFPAGDLPEGESLYAALLADPPAPAAIDQLLGYTAVGDEFRLLDRTIYIRYRQSSHKSKLSNAFFEQKLGVWATTRNWQTLNKLVAMGRAMAETGRLA